MEIYKLIYINLFILLFLACGGEQNPEKWFDLRLEGNSKTFTVGEEVGVDVVDKNNKGIKKVTYALDGETVSLVNGKLNLDVERLGEKTLTAEIEYEGGKVSVSRSLTVLSDISPEIYTYKILNTYPHDIKAFTQGLEFYNDTLYESTGQKGKSVLRKLNYSTGEVYKEIALEPQFFGEGITIIDDRVIQLTWQSGVGFIYNARNLEKTGSFKYGSSKEGWGLCNDGEYIFKSDGTEKIWLLDPRTLDEKGFLQAVTNKSLFNKTNELEYVNGKIYANVWQKPSMMILNSKTGAIEGVVNFSGLEKKVKQHDQLDVLNGVAYHPGRNTFFVTGKHWDRLFEVKIIKRD